MKNSCLQWDSNPGPFASEANSLSVALLVEIPTTVRVSFDVVNLYFLSNVMAWFCIKMSSLF